MDAKTKGLETKMRILESLRGILLEKRLASISIADICNGAGVSRQTFYNHFIDKYDIYHWFFEMVANRYLYEAGRSLSYHDANLLNNRAFANNWDFVRALFQEEGYQSLLSYSRRKRRATLEETIVVIKGAELTKDLTYLLNYHVEAETKTIYHWICDYPDDSPEYVADILDRAIPSEINAIIRDPTPGCARPSDFLTGLLA